MNGSKAGDVNPHFMYGCTGAWQKQRTAPFTEAEKKAAGRYLDWYTGILLKTDGKMGIYRKESVGNLL